ncbi:MAG: hypothetical protein AAGD28_07665 [Bacteroidota bacterium]
MKQYRIWIRLNWIVLVLFLIILAIQILSWIEFNRMMNGTLFEENQDEKFQLLIKSVEAQSQNAIIKYSAFSALSAVSLWVLYALKKKHPDTGLEESLIDQIGEE